MQRSKCLILFFLVASFNLSLAQDTGNFTQFFFNPYSLNPSFAGIDGHGALFLAYRKQWSGIEGGPEIVNLSYHSPLNSRLSIGVNAANDKRGLLSNSGLLITMAYSVPISEGIYLRFGLSGGGSWNTVDLNKIQSPNMSDPALVNLMNQNASIIGNAGLSLHLKSFHIGAALPNLFTPSYVSQDEFSITEVKPFQSVVVHASNRFYFSDNKHVFEPYAVYRINNGLPSQYEFAAVLHLNHIVWLGGSYKQEFGISALGGFKVNNLFAIGGSYTLKNSGINELNFPTYEIHLSILGGSSKSKNKNKSKAKTNKYAIYSFVQTELPKKTKTEILNDNYLVAINKADKALASKNYEPARLAYYEALKFKPNENYPKTKISEIDKILTYQSTIKKADEAFATKTYSDALANYEAATTLNPQEQYPKDKIAEIKALLTTRNSESDLDKRYNEAILKADQAMAAKNYNAALLAYNEALTMKGTESYPKNKIAEINALLAAQVINTEEKKPVEQVERHETVKRGTNQLELKPGNYVIVGVFGAVANAKNMTRSLVDSGLNANYGFLTEKNLWYVHVFEGDDINAARSERNRFRNQPTFKNAWLLTVEN